METMAYRPQDLAVDPAVQEPGLVVFEGCQEQMTFDLGEREMLTTARVLDVALTLRNLCPGRRAAVGVTVCERDAQGREYPRGFRAVTVTGRGQGKTCPVETLRFILPEDLRVDDSGCRRFVVRATAHYVDQAVTF